MSGSVPRLIVAGSAGDSGKTTVSLGLLSAWRDRGLAPVSFKKGPDFIDAAWLGWASGNVGRNLDTYLMPEGEVRRSFWRHGGQAGVSLIEGNRGLLDGKDTAGTQSTAALARLLDAPVLLVLPVTKVTRTAAATVVGIKHLEPDLNLAGVVLNRVAGPRHRRVCAESIEELAGVPVLGAIPRIQDTLLADRHLGLVPPAESDGLQDLRDRLTGLAEEYLDLDRILEAARAASAPGHEAGDIALSKPNPDRVRIGVIRDSAFTFYYPENLEALEARGANLVTLNSMEDGGLPDDIDALYVGGGFPETHAERIAANRPFLNAVKAAAEDGLPIYAECGGLMLLSQTFGWRGVHYRMAGVFPLHLAVGEKPAKSHGYMRVRVDRANPFYEVGTELTGHEFHYSYPKEGTRPLPTAMAVARGGGCFDGRDGLATKNVLASYLHVHALGAPQFAAGLVAAAVRHRDGATRKGTRHGAKAN